MSTDFLRATIDLISGLLNATWSGSIMPSLDVFKDGVVTMS